MSESRQRISLPVFVGTIVFLAIGTALATALLMNIFERKMEAKEPYQRMVEVTEDDTDPALWGKNWPRLGSICKGY